MKNCPMYLGLNFRACQISQCPFTTSLDELTWYIVCLGPSYTKSHDFVLWRIDKYFPRSHLSHWWSYLSMPSVIVPMANVTVTFKDVSWESIPISCIYPRDDIPLLSAQFDLFLPTLLSCKLVKSRSLSKPLASVITPPSSSYGFVEVVCPWTHAY